MPPSSLYGFAYTEPALAFLETQIPIKIRKQIKRRIAALADNKINRLNDGLALGLVVIHHCPVKVLGARDALPAPCGPVTFVPPYPPPLAAAAAARALAPAACTCALACVAGIAAGGNGGGAGA